MAEQPHQLGLSVLIELPPHVSEDQAKQLAQAFERTLVDFTQALDVPGESIRIDAVQGPAEPISMTDVEGVHELPGVVLRHDTHARE
jgi:hypothetical protein